MKKITGIDNVCERSAVLAGGRLIKKKKAADGVTVALAAADWKVFDTLQNNDAYHALQAVNGLIITGATGTNVNDVAVVLIGGEEQADA